MTYYIFPRYIQVFQEMFMGLIHHIVNRHILPLKLAKINQHRLNIYFF
jgi:hypothetical protein